ncbi:glycosyltransferase [Streptomyces sp. A1547]|uniref:glycosyltransferase family 2 protein n=1 Tax=Streptomyces sp. A1547 TaxID=2563105 RepID=UPI00109EDB4F|nr:glycosyltransferase [Streptomyces sp. A1547]THA30040.1 glycosyltransferase family 2 protein [Streptomyces sp. A1547]
MLPAHIAVLITSHNRREKTLSALSALHVQRGLPEDTEVRIHLVDAGSTDGTPEAVRAAHPRVEVVTVGDDVYWGQGMRIASRNSHAAGLPPWEYQLWLNDDVVLDRDALAVLLDTVRAVRPGAVVVGAVRARNGAHTTYSGRSGRALTLVEPTGRPEPCDTYNGNVVLLPRAVHERIGDIDKVFRHGMGDYDHGFRARRAGIPAYVSPRHVGSCDRNPPDTGSREPGIGVREALRRVTSQRELPPRQWWVYCRRHAWPWAPLLMVSPYLKTVARALAGRRVGGGEYPR